MGKIAIPFFFGWEIHSGGRSIISFFPVFRRTRRVHPSGSHRVTLQDKTRGHTARHLPEHPEGQSAPAGAPVQESTDKKGYIVIFSIFKCSLDKLHRQNNGRQKNERPEELWAQGNDKNHLFGLWKRVRGPLQANRGKARLLSRVPSEAPEAAILIIPIFSTSFFRSLRSLREPEGFVPRPGIIPTVIRLPLYRLLPRPLAFFMKKFIPCHPTL